MKLYFILAFMFTLTSCIGSSKNNSPQVSSGEIAATQAAKTFIKNSRNEIPSSLQVNHSDLQGLTQDGLVTPEEASQISENL